jgi:4,5-dihydroxyphthalate decarboxylase
VTRVVTIATRNYDYLGPLACGDVSVEGADLTLIRDNATALDRVSGDPAVHGGEFSFSRYVGWVAAGDPRWVGMPFFVLRAFRQRSFFIRRGSRLQHFADLAGKRVGANEWGASGSTWARAVLRDAGVRIEDIAWWVGSVDGLQPDKPLGPLPPHARAIPAGRTLQDMLLDDELDALMCPQPPRRFHEPDRPIVRLVPDFRRAEREYFRRTGIFPPQHIIVLRRESHDAAPWLAARLYAALEQSKRRWQGDRRRLTDAFPWTLAELEETEALMGEDWLPNGVEANRRPIQAFLDEQLAQGLIRNPVSIEALFGDFQTAAASVPASLDA